MDCVSLQSQIVQDDVAQAVADKARVADRTSVAKRIMNIPTPPG
jgi:hypothetical protein